MRKQLISICTTVILIFSIYGCAKTSKDALTTETENIESQDTVAESGEASAEGELDKKAALEEHDQGEDETDLMTYATEQDIFTYMIDDNR